MTYRAGVAAPVLIRSRIIVPCASVLTPLSVPIERSSPVANTASTARPIRTAAASSHVLEEHLRRENRTHRRRDVPSRVLGRGSVDGLEHRDPSRMDVAGRGDPQTALNRRAQIREDVPEHVGDNHGIEGLGFLTIHMHAASMYAWSRRMSGSPGLLEGARPEIHRRHRVGFVDHRELLRAISLPAEIERVPEHALDSFPREDHLLERHLVRRPLEVAPDSHVHVFRVLAHHHQVDVLGSLPLQGRDARRRASPDAG